MLLLLVMRVMERKINRPILELVFYVVIRNMEKIKYYCPCTDGEIEEQNLLLGVKTESEPV